MKPILLALASACAIGLAGCGPRPAQDAEGDTAAAGDTAPTSPITAGGGQGGTVDSETATTEPAASAKTQPAG